MANKDQSKITITQINPPQELNEEEKRTIKIYEMEQADELLSKTMKFKALNTKKIEDDFNLPKTKDQDEDDLFTLPKPKDKTEDFPKNPSLYDTVKIKINDLFNKKEEKESLYNTVKIKLSELRTNIDKSYEEKDKKRKSLYDTVIIKLDNLINSKNALKLYNSNKVTNTEELNTKYKRKLFTKNITKLNSDEIKINVESDEFGRQLYNLNRIALTKLSNDNNTDARRFNNAARLNRIEKIHVSKVNYLQYQKRISQFAINKLYYKLAPKETKKYKLYRASVILSSIVFLITGVIITNWFIQGLSINKMSYSIQEETNVELIDDGLLYKTVDDIDNLETEEEKNLYWKYLNTPLSSIDFTDLLKQNQDTVGWLIVNNTNVNYPVVQTKDNDYYLKHAFDRSINSAGWVFADFRNNLNEFNRNTVIYAHGRKDRVMFGSLVDTLDATWYTNLDNQIIQLSTLNYNSMWQIISIYKINAESYYITTDFSSDASFETFISTIKDRSLYDFNINVSKDDKILTLSTCYNDNGIRLVIHAKLVKIHTK